MHCQCLTMGINSEHNEPAFGNAKNNGGAAHFLISERNIDVQKIILTIPACSWWSMWKERNKRRNLLFYQQVKYILKFISVYFC